VPAGATGTDPTRRPPDGSCHSVRTADPRRSAGELYRDRSAGARHAGAREPDPEPTQPGTRHPRGDFAPATDGGRSRRRHFVAAATDRLDARLAEAAANVDGIDLDVRQCLTIGWSRSSGSLPTWKNRWRWNNVMLRHYDSLSR